MKKWVAVFGLWFGLVSGSSSVWAKPLQLYGPIADHAVIQRDAPIRFSGSGQPSEPLTISFANQTLPIKVDDTGEWTVAFDPLPAGGPYTLSISSNDARITADDLLIGDVWLCSGQSNMEYPVYRALNPDTEIAGPHSDQIRLFSVPSETALSPSDTFLTPPNWQIASPETVRDFSAVCYFTAKNIFDDVPMGLIDSSWGGSQIEAWLSEQSLRTLGMAEASLDTLALYRTDPSAAMLAYGQSWQDWWTQDTDNRPWLLTDAFDDWSKAPADMQDWNEYGDPNLAGYTGRVWFTRNVTLTEAQAEQDAVLSLGIIDEKDVTWVNGTLVGAMDSWSEGRQYSVGKQTLRSGQNTIIVMAENGYGAGGMIGPNDAVSLSFEQGQTIDLNRDWRYKIADERGAAPTPPWSATSGYSTIYNAMIAPLGEWPLAGAIWYQGESNTGRGNQYQPLMQSLIDGWRARFGDTIKVLIVQLPGYGGMPDTPGASGWSEVREAQRQVALGDPHTGLVVAIDAGDRTDIHPANKQLIASRAAAVFNVLSGEQRGYADGLAPVSIERSGQQIILTMPTKDLKVISHSQPVGFELCAPDNQCDWANATVSGAEITLTSKLVREPAYVRYCWGDAPICNLFDHDNLPVVPFQEAIQ